jgi:renal tumor antigen
MDLFAAGCVAFETIALFPLFPGQNEMDQVQKIHNILGRPSKELLDKFQRHASHMDFNFPPKEASGIARLIPHVTTECQELILRLLAYNPEERLSARQALKSPYFRDLRDAEKQDNQDRTESKRNPEEQEEKAEDQSAPALKAPEAPKNTEEADGDKLPPIANNPAPSKQKQALPKQAVYKSQQQQQFKTLSHGFTTGMTGAGIVGMPPPAGSSKFGFASMTNFSTSNTSSNDKASMLMKKKYVSPYTSKKR